MLKYLTMSKTYRPYQPDQMFLMPPSLKEWLPEGHLAYFVSDLVDELDLSDIIKPYEREERGYPPYHPVMMTKILFYAYCTGVYSSRMIASRCEEDVGFRMLAANSTPDFRTISDFRKRHLGALKSLFGQVFQMCKRAGLVKMGHVSLDGTKVKANASRHKAMSYGRMKDKELEYEAVVRELFSRADSVDAEEDRRYGELRGDELPEELAFHEKRLAKIREAKQALEREAREKAAAILKEHEEEQKKREREGRRKKPGNPPDPPKVPDDKAQRNFTDPDSKIMKGPQKNFVQAYNCQAAVDDKAQIIVACDAAQEGVDHHQALPMAEKIKENAGKYPKEMSMDNGYYSDDNALKLEEKGIDAYIATGKEKHTEPSSGPPRGRIPAKASCKERMSRKLKTKRGRQKYKKRKVIVEPVYGQIKECRGFRQFLLRGIEKVRSEWSLVCMAHNIRKMHVAGVVVGG
jgi:transposase